MGTQANQNWGATTSDPPIFFSLKTKKEKKPTHKAKGRKRKGVVWLLAYMLKERKGKRNCQSCL